MLNNYFRSHNKFYLIHFPLHFSKIFWIFFLFSPSSFAQVVIEERIEIGGITSKDNLKKGSSIIYKDDIPSGFIMPKSGLLQVYYNFIDHFDWELPDYSTLNSYYFKGDSTSVDSLSYRFTSYIIDTRTFYNYCPPAGWEDRYVWMYLSPDPYLYDLGNVAEGDSVQMIYHSDMLGVEGDIPISLANEYWVDSVLVGWDVTFAYFDGCINEYVNVLQMFVGVLKEYELVVSIEPEEITPGDTAEVVLKKKLPDGTLVDFDSTQTFEVGMMEGCMSGKLIVGTPPDTGSYFYNIYQPIRFAAADSLVGDSTGSVIIQVGVVDSVEEQINREKLLKGIMPDGVIKKTKAKHPMEKPASDVLLTFCFNPTFWRTGEPKPDTLTIKKYTILLGETKYYQAKYDENSELMIEELLTPQLNGGLNIDVWADNPITAVTCDTCGNKLGVYWEKEKPIYGTTDTLQRGLIRLAGRHWHADSTYIVRLRAKRNDDSAYIKITVKKPKKLGNSNSTSIDVFGDTIYVDKLCIDWGGELGIPPHFIKGQMKSETSACSPFYPTYVFEPYTTQFNILQDYTYHNNQFFVKDDQTTFDPPVPNHSNVKDFNYYTSPTSVWQILEDHSELVNLISGCGQRKYGTRIKTDNVASREDGILYFYGVYSYPQNKYDEYKKNAYKKYDVENHSDKEAQANNEARDSLINHLKNEWDGGVKDGKKGLINIKAQTRMGASYGLLQILYTTAYKDFNYPPNTVPEFLNEPDGMLYSKKKLERHLKDLIKKENGVNNWTLGLEESFKKYIWHKWNPGWAEYPIKVLENVMLFKEISD